VDPVYPFLKCLGYSLIIIHADSLTKDVSGHTIDYHKEYKLIDIGKKGVKLTIKLIKQLNPIAIIIPGFRGLLDLLMIRIGKFISIKTIYLEHGLTNEFHLKFAMANKKASVNRYLRITKMFLNFLLINPKSFLNELKIVYLSMFKTNYKLTKFDYAIFYAKNGVDFLNQAFSFDKKQVFYSGYPFVNNIKDLHSVSCDKEINTNKKILYIHQPFIIDGLSKISYQEETQHFIQISNVFNQFNYDFILQLHPRDSIEMYNRLLAQTNIIIKQSKNLCELFEDCNIMMGFDSTALFVGIALYKPLIILDYPRSRSFNKTLMEDISIRINNLNELCGILNSPDNLKINLQKYDRFIDEYIGRNNSFEHQAHTIDRIIRNDK